MKKFLIILIIIFICGLISADICLKQIHESEVLVGLEYYKRYANTKLMFKDAFLNILYERAKFLIGIVLLSITPLKKNIRILLAPLFSYAWGFYFMSCIVELGAVGVAVGLASVVPHGILYVSFITLLIGRRRNSFYIKNSLARDIGVYIFMSLLFLTACIIESLVATHFIPWIIRLSLI